MKHKFDYKTQKNDPRSQNTQHHNPELASNQLS